MHTTGQLQSCLDLESKWEQLVRACMYIRQVPEHKVEPLNIICLSPRRWGGKQQPADVKLQKLKVDQPKKSPHLSPTICDSSMAPSNSPSTTHGSHSGSTHPGSNQDNLTGQGQPPCGQMATAVRQALQNRVNEQEAELQWLKGMRSHWNAMFTCLIIHSWSWQGPCSQTWYGASRCNQQCGKNEQDTIDKPKGSAGNGFVLINKMELQDKRQTYLNIQVCVNIHLIKWRLWHLLQLACLAHRSCPLPWRRPQLAKNVPSTEYTQPG